MEHFKKNPNLQGLLKFAMEITQKEDAPKQLDENGDEIQNSSIEENIENREFLRLALDSLTVDVIKELEKAIKILEDDSSSLDDKKEAFDIIRDHVVNIDFAVSFTKFGGAEIISKYLQADDLELQILALNTNAELAQNNPFCQDHLHKSGIIEMLLSLMKSDNESLASAAIYALSAITVSFRPGLLEFLAKGGLHALLQNLTTSHARVFIKTCFLISNLSAEYGEVRDEFAKKHAFDIAASQLEVVDGFDVKAEALLVALKEICKSDEFKVEEKVIASTTAVLDELLEKTKDLPECEEMNSYASYILRKICPEKYDIKKTVVANGIATEGMHDEAIAAGGALMLYENNVNGMLMSAPSTTSTRSMASTESTESMEYATDDEQTGSESQTQTQTSTSTSTSTSTETETDSERKSSTTDSEKQL